MKPAILTSILTTTLMVASSAKEPSKPAGGGSGKISMKAASFELEGTGYYLDQGKWLAINPDARKTAKVATASPLPDGRYETRITCLSQFTRQQV